MPQKDLVIPDLFKAAAAKSPDKTALQIKKGDFWVKFTYRQLEELSLKVASFLLRQGLNKADHVGIIMENRPEWPAIYLGIVSAGLVCVPVDPQLNPQEIKNIISDSQSKVIFCSFNIFKNKFSENIPDYILKFVLLDSAGIKHQSLTDFCQLQDLPIEEGLMRESYGDDIASLIYTSGTTALPKGVLLSHKNICSNFLSIEQSNIFSSCDNILAILPLHHTYAFMVTLIVPLFYGATITYASSLKPQEFIGAIKETKVTLLAAVPQLLYLIHKSILERIHKIPFFLRGLLHPAIKLIVRRQIGQSIRLMISGGARLEPKVNRALSGLGFKLIEGYGLTETSPVVTLNPLRKMKIGSVGKPIPGVQIRIIDPDASGVGQVLIKGPNVMQGYFKQPQATSQVIRDGWFYSGDLGRIDSEGYLFLTGREKDVIVLSSGKNIYPEELEDYYSRSLYIKELCVLSQRQESFGNWIESLYAVIVPDLEYFREKNETDIRGKIRWELENLGRSLPSYSHIMGFVITKEELPRTPLKKIKRYQVKEKYLGDKSAAPESKEGIACEEDRAILNKEAAQRIIKYICRELNRLVDLNSHLEIDLGIDSLSRVEFGLGLEAMFKIKIPDELLYSFATVKDVIINVEKLREGGAPAASEDENEKKEWSQILSVFSEEKLAKKMNFKVGFSDRIIVFLSWAMLFVVFKIFWRLKNKGRDNLPAAGPYLICPNHGSYLDGFAIFASLPLKTLPEVFFLGYSKIFEHPFIHWGARKTRLVSIDPNIHLTEAMQAVSFAIKHKKIVCIFPEGRRSIDNNIGEFKKGVGILIKELDIPVIPVYIKGSHYSWPRGSRLPRPYPLEVIFGPKRSAQELAQKTEAVSDKYQAISRSLREEVLKLAC